MKFTVYGSGCAKCRQLTDHAEQAARQRGVPFELEKVTAMNEIIDAGVMRTPALAIDGALQIEGKVASVEEIFALLG